MGLRQRRFTSVERLEQSDEAGELVGNAFLYVAERPEVGQG